MHNSTGTTLGSIVAAFAISAFASISSASADAGSYTVVHQFSTRHDRGFAPNAVVLGSHNVIYGTTAYGGKPKVFKDNCRSTDACGTIYRLRPDGTLNVLHTFYGIDAGAPNGELFLQGNTLYGATAPEINNRGTIFSIGTDGNNYKTLFVFSPNQDLSIGYALAVDPNGVVYGTTLSGYQGSPILFKLDTNGVFTSLINSTSNYDPIISLALSGDTLAFEEYVPNVTTLQSYNLASGQITSIYKFPPFGGSEELAGIDQQGNVFGLDHLYRSHLFEFVKTAGGYRHQMLWTFNTIPEDIVTSLTLLSNGGLIGTTQQQQPRNGIAGTGTIFQYDHHQLTTLFRTRTQADGLDMDTAPVITGDGKIIGVAPYGGTALCIFSGAGCGVVYTLGPASP